ncbi:MAG: hypothetical protein KGK03_09300 [Candidatus Omnitrophica bacterium]|nr:hypothetical protein [Candidatus Omnitrophota bacterium]
MPENVQTHKCIICGRPARTPNAEYCRYCYDICMRMSWDRFPPEAIESVWEYIRTYDYVCYYTKIPLDMDNPKSPWYCVFDHWIPGDPHRIVLTCALVNDMKTEQTEDEFWYNIFQLADYKRLGKPINMKAPAGWCRLLPPLENESI